MPRRHFCQFDILICHSAFLQNGLDRKDNTVLYFCCQRFVIHHGRVNVWCSNYPEEVTLFPYIMDGLAARGKPCQKNTLIVLLSRLMNKGFLSAKKIGRRNEYTTLVSETEYQTTQTKHFLDKIYEGSVKGLVSNLILGDLLADEEYEELKRLLEKGRWQQ